MSLLINPRKLKALLVEKGITQVSIARELDPPIDRSVVSKVISGKARSRRVQAKLAQKLDMPHEALWSA